MSPPLFGGPSSKMLPDDIIPEARPTIHVTNWSSRRLHGPGRRLSIMAKPRRWEHGEGNVPACTPLGIWLDWVRTGQIDIADYQRRIEGKLSIYPLTPGNLVVDSVPPDVVRDGDTLLCACSREEAAAGRCHRVWVAAALARAGWRVVLDGAEVVP